MLLLRIRLEIRLKALRDASTELIYARLQLGETFHAPLILQLFECLLVLKVFVNLQVLSILRPDIISVSRCLHNDLTILDLHLIPDLLVGAIKLLVKLIFKLESLMHSLNDHGHVDLLSRQDFIDVQLRHPTELICIQLRHLPLIREDFE